jgi:hypothetical protein
VLLTVPLCGVLRPAVAPARDLRASA